ncbi:HAMP domain-containing histidine kinase [Simkania negevensis]|uniref:histidine kinase n=1 Tax=Simkania negevensis TaxID=83561 RepID=A0ABS3ASZ7_9BACT|nr:HAMP domain-containing histidine kinase [Simkania negevensis]
MTRKGSPLAYDPLRANPMKEEEFSNEQLRNHKVFHIGILAVGLIHEFNNLLTGLFSSLSVLRLNLKDTTTLNYLDLIEQKANRAFLLTRSLLTFLRNDDTSQTPTDPIICINEAIEMTRHAFQKIINLDLRLPQYKYPVAISKTELNQILVNLLINAYDAIAVEGDISVHAQYEEGYFTFKIADTGQGMAPETKKQIFTPFYSTKESSSGIGLGLTIIKYLIDRAGGKVDVKSTPGNGSTFSISLPLARDV